MGRTRTLGRGRTMGKTRTRAKIIMTLQVLAQTDPDQVLANAVAVA